MPVKPVITKSKAPTCGKANAWMFTIHNPTSEHDPTQWEGVRYVTWQLEKCPTTGTPHYQGYVEFEKQKRLAGVRKVCQCHWEMRMASQQEAIKYCNKEATREDGPWESGTPAKGQGNRSDLDKMCELVQAGTNMREVALSNMPMFVVHNRGLAILAQTIGVKYNHDDVRGVWYWGGPGTGKSRKAREEYPDAYLKSQNKWFDGYIDQDAIILDDLDKLGGDKLGHHLKIWADRYACNGEVKGSQVNLKHKVFVITSNYHPDELWPDDEQMLEAIKRRFKITHFPNTPFNKKKDTVANQIKESQSYTQCPFGCPDTDACMCVQSGRAERQLSGV
ncbi:hypothetical protein [uncultured marine virus]|uniref:ATP-dependent helicase Rep n=1 Tax=uncultured marine virus TaxID=186617 RepID=S4TF60_9VIRU|nr:hypothetical protein [uncultured marine virus]